MEKEKESDVHKIARLELIVQEQREKITTLQRVIDEQNDIINFSEFANKKIVPK